MCVSPCVFWSPRGRWRNLINKNWSLGKYDQSRKLWTFRMEATWKQWETGSNLKVYFLYKKKSNYPRAWRSQTPAAAIAKYPSCLGNPVDTRPESHVGKAHAVVHQFRGRENDFGEARWWKEAKSYLFCERHQISRIPVKEKLPHRLSSHCLTSRIASPPGKKCLKKLCRWIMAKPRANTQPALSTQSFTNHVQSKNSWCNQQTPLCRCARRNPFYK